jgi:hypothetical protein
MVYNYNKDNIKGVKVFYNGETKWQPLVRAMIKLSTQFSAMEGREYTIEKAHLHINTIKSKTHRIRAHKRLGKWIRETED